MTIGDDKTTMAVAVAALESAANELGRANAEYEDARGKLLGRVEARRSSRALLESLISENADRAQIGLAIDRLLGESVELGEARGLAEVARGRVERAGRSLKDAKNAVKRLVEKIGSDEC